MSTRVLILTVAALMLPFVSVFEGESAQGSLPRAAAALPTADLIADWDSRFNVTTSTHPTTSEKLVTSWTDMSGNGWVATQGNSSKPRWKDTPFGKSISFKGTQQLYLPSSLVIDPKSVSIYIVAQFESGRDNSDEVLVELGGVTNSLKFSMADHPTDISSMQFGGSLTDIHKTTSVATHWVSSGATALRAGNGPESGAYAPTAQTQPLAGGILGSSRDSAKSVPANMYRVLIYEVAHTPKQTQAVLSYLESAYPVVNRMEPVFFVLEGHSLQRGARDIDYSYFNQWMASSGRSPMSLNASKGGRDLLDPIDGALLHGPTLDVELAHRSQYGRKIAVLWCGSSDLKGGETAQDIIDAQALWVQERKAAGAVTVIFTMMKRWDFDQDQEDARVHINGMIRSGSSGADIVVDTAAHPKLQDPWNRYYDPDKVHMSKIGYAIVSTLFGQKLDAYFGW